MKQSDIVHRLAEDLHKYLCTIECVTSQTDGPSRHYIELFICDWLIDNNMRFVSLKDQQETK